jgi:hypothetical protein
VWARQLIRNTTRSGLMFVRSSHPLSPYLYALHDRVHGLSTTERALQKDHMDPVASAGACFILPLLPAPYEGYFGAKKWLFTHQ